MKFQRCGVHLPVNNLKETLSYYRDTLGFYDEWIFNEKDGGIRRDDLRLLFGEDPEYTQKLNSATNRLNLLWFVENIDDIFAEFNNRNIAIVSSLQEYTYQLREFAFIDINGYYIRIAESTDKQL